MRNGFAFVVSLLAIGSFVFLWGTETGSEVLALWREGSSAPLDGVAAADSGQAHGARQASTLPPQANALRVLFVGNSHTFENDLPSLVAGLAQAAGQQPLYFELIARGGAKLMEHAAEGHVNEALSRGGWHALVLQEQQQWPTLGREQRARELNAPARVMSLNAQAIGARVIVQMVWARREGDPMNVPGDTFAAMHERGVVGHRELAQEIGAELAPASVAWKRALEARPELSLWQADGSHPALAGSYLAACVLYRTLYKVSPSGNGFTAGLAVRDAAFLQEVAATTELR